MTKWQVQKQINVFFGIFFIFIYILYLLKLFFSRNGEIFSHCESQCLSYSNAFLVKSEVRTVCKSTVWQQSVLVSVSALVSELPARHHGVFIVKALGAHVALLSHDVDHERPAACHPFILLDTNLKPWTQYYHWWINGAFKMMFGQTNGRNLCNVIKQTCVCSIKIRNCLCIAGPSHMQLFTLHSFLH